MIFKPYVLSQFGVGNDFDSFNKQVCIFIDGMWFDRDEFLNADFKVLLNCEPPNVSKEVCSIDDIIKNHKMFDLILTLHEEVLDKCDNSILFPFGTSWISEGFVKKSSDFEISFLCGNKNHLQGHMLRQNIFNNLRHIDNIPVKDFYNGLVSKDIVFDTSQFSIIVENSSVKNYFTEKIIDCFITKTIPLYWGCPNIGTFFDKKGIICFNDVDELFSKIKLLTPDTYIQKKDIVEKNYIKSLMYKNLFFRVNEEINIRL